MTLNPLLPLPWIVMLVGVAWATTWLWMPRPRKAMAMRTAAVVLLGLVLLNPMRQSFNAAEVKVPATEAQWLIADDSASMATGDRFQQVVAAFSGETSVQKWLIGEDVRAWSRAKPHANGSASQLLTGMRQLISQAPNGATMLLASDGHDTSPRGDDPAAWRDVAELAAAKNIRIDVWPVGDGSTAPVKPRLTLSASPEAVFEGQRVSMTAVIERSGPATDAAPLTVRLLKDDRVIQQATTTWEPSRRLARVTFEDAPFAGGANGYAGYRAETDEASDELLVCNRGRKIRVLMLVGEPDVASRTMIDALRADEHIGLTVVQAITDQRLSITQYHGSAALSGRVESLSQLLSFDAVIAGKNIESLVDESAMTGYAKARPGGIVRIAGDIWRQAFGPDATDRSRAAYRADVLAKVQNAAGIAHDSAALSVWTEPVNADVGRRVTIQVADHSGMMDTAGVATLSDTTGRVTARVAMQRDAADAMRATGSWAATGAGLMHVRYATAESAVMVRTTNEELRDISVRPEGLRILAENTGGQVVHGLDERRVYEPTSMAANAGGKKESVLLNGVVMAAIIVLLGGAWIARRWSGER